MTSKDFRGLLFVVIGVIAALYAALDIVTSGGNQLGQLAYYMMIGTGLYAMMNPKGGIYVLIVCSAYLDVLKRLLVVAGSVSWFDIYWAMGVAPVTVAGAYFGVLAQSVGVSSGERTPSRTLTIHGILVTALLALGTIFVLASGNSSSSKLQLLANAITYMSMMLILPFCFRTAKELRKLLSFTVIVFIPVALYFFHQYFYGLAWWEDAYLRKGFSIEVRQFNMAIFRYFSTMNNAQSLSTMMCILVVVAMAAPWREGAWRLRTYFNIRAVLILLLFGAAAVLTFSRGGWVAGLAAIFASLCFRRRFLTISFCVVCISVIVMLFVGSDFLLKNKVIERIDRAVLSGNVSDEQIQMARLGTFTMRLEGMRRLMDSPRSWRPFGVIFEKEFDESQLMNLQSDYYAHDFVSEFIIKYGYVTAVSFVLLGIGMAIWYYRWYFAIEDPEARKLALLGVSCACGIVASGIGNASITRMFPVNMFLYFFVGYALAPVFWRRDEERKRKLELRRANEVQSARRTSGVSSLLPATGRSGA